MKTIDIELGGLPLKLAPLPLATLAELQEEGVEVQSLTLANSAGLIAFSRAIGASLRRSHPEVTDEFVLMNIDATNGVELVSKFSEVNGLKSVSVGSSDSPNSEAV